MAKNAGKKATGKKNLKDVKKMSKVAAAVKTPSKSKPISAGKTTLKVVASKDLKIAKPAVSSKGVKETLKTSKPIQKVSDDKKLMPETESPREGILSKIAGKIFKSENRQKENKKTDPTPKAQILSAKVETVPPEIEQIKAQKKIKEPKAIPNEIVQVDVVEVEQPTKKQSKKAQAAFQAATEEEAKWLELKEKYKGLRPAQYKMSEIYQEKTLLDHKVLGLGVILSVVNDRLEVLFQTGTKHLISNYKK